ncbi:MAG: outer membrane lipoprotein-sorting protein [Spirochaetia bacterium]|jgi:outer membrane lipoprotein-sorting protein
MKRFTALSAVLALAAAAAMPGAAQGLSAAQILDKVDQSVNGPKDQSYTSSLVLIDSDGKEKTREVLMLQKGRDKRLVRFESPADQRGIAFLSLPGDVQYLYLPAFAKVRRIASQIKNTSFAGTDFTYEDLEASPWSEKWNTAIARSEEKATVLELTLKPGKESSYSRLLVWVTNDSFYPVRIEHYDRSGSLSKILVREQLQQVSGYWVSMVTSMEDVKKHHKTRMTISDIKLDTGISDDKFTERSLSR